PGALFMSVSKEMTGLGRGRCRRPSACRRVILYRPPPGAGSAPGPCHSSLTKPKMSHRPTPVPFVFCLVLAALVALLASPTALARTVRVYDVEIKGDAAGPAVQDAMRRVLVRATGRRESGADPAFAALVADAPRYVQSSRKVSNGSTLVTFDGAAVEQAIAS